MPATALGRRVHDVHPARKSPIDEVAHQRAADRVVRRLAPMTATLRASKKRWIDAVSARCSRDDITSCAVSVGSIENRISTTPSSKPPLDLVAGVPEHLLHPGVLGQHLGDELLAPQLAPDLGEVLEQQLAEAAVLVGVLDEEGDLRLLFAGRPVEPLELADRDHLLGRAQRRARPAPGGRRR